MSYYRRIRPFINVSLDPITVAWLAQLTTSFGSNPSSTFITALDTMIRGMRTDGDLLLLDRFWIFAQEVQGYARVSIVNPGSTQITEVNSPTWTANQGYTGNATTSYLNTNFNYSTHAVNATRTNISHGVYSRTNSAVNQQDTGATVGAGTCNMAIQSKWSDNICYTATNGRTNNFSSSAVADSLGLFSGTRVNTTNHTGYHNGVAFTAASIADLALPNLNDFVLGRNLNGALSLPSARQLSMRFIGAGNINQANFYSRFQTFATSIGFNV